MKNSHLHDTIRLLITLSTGWNMAEISRFFGIIIQMFGSDHNPPHFHAIYNEFRAMFDIKTGELIEGEFPLRQLKYVQVWADIHKTELLENFKTLNAEIQTCKKIRPLT